MAIRPQQPPSLPSEATDPTIRFGDYNSLIFSSSSGGFLSDGARRGCFEGGILSHRGGSYGPDLGGTNYGLKAANYGTKVSITTQRLLTPSAKHWWTDGRLREQFC